MRAGSRLPVTGNRAHDDGRVGLRQHGVVQTQPRHDPRAEIFHHHVIGTHKLLDDVSRGGALEIEGQALLAAVELAVHGADALTHRRHVTGELPSRRLDFQHLRPQISHQPGAVRPGDDRGEIQNANAVQHPRAGQSFVCLHDGSSVHVIPILPIIAAQDMEIALWRQDALAPTKAGGRGGVGVRRSLDSGMRRHDQITRRSKTPRRVCLSAGPNV